MSPNDPADWPFIGRGEELTRAVTTVVEGRRAGLVVAGPPGVGKTRLAMACQEAAAMRGMVTARVQGTRAAATIPAGAIAPLWEDDRRGARTEAEMLASAGQAVAGLGGGRPVLLLADDAHLLDELSATVLHQAAASGSAFVVATVRSDEEAPEAITALWLDGVADRLDLAPLSAIAVDELLHQVLRGQVDSAASRRLWAASEGNPLLLRELILAGRTSGGLRTVEGVWRLGDLPESSPRLVELVESRLAGLSTAQRATLEAVAVAEDIGLSMLAGAGLSDPVDSLVALDLLRTDAAGNVSMAHPVHGEVVRAGMGALRARTVKSQLADVMEGSEIRLAVWRLEAGASVDPNLMAQAARQAADLFSYRLAERLARAAVDAGGGWDATTLLGEILAKQGLVGDADAALSAAASVAASQDQVALTAIMRANNLFWGLLRRDEAGAVIAGALAVVEEPLWHAALTVSKAGFAIQGGRPAAALEELVPLLDNPVDQIVAGAAIVAAPALVLTGRLSEAQRVATAGLGAHRRAGAGALPFMPELHQVMAVLAMIEAGRLLDAVNAAGEGYRVALVEGADQIRAWFATMLGRAEILLGRTEAAVRSSREATSLHRAGGQFGMARLGLTGLALSLAHLQRFDEAEQRLGDADELGSPDEDLFGAESYRARAWIAVGRGNSAAAAGLLASGAAVARASGEHVVEAAALHDLARIGRAADAADRLGDLAGMVEGVLTATRAAHAAALADDDPDELLVVAGAFEAMSALVFAAEAWAAAAESFTRVGNGRRAVAARRRAVILAGRCEGTRTPGLAAATEDGALSDREREVVALAAENLTDRQIAERLYLSVRTVNNHLQRVYTKLGISSRSELARALEEVEGTGP